MEFTENRRKERSSFKNERKLIEMKGTERTWKGTELQEKKRRLKETQGNERQ